MWIFQKDRVKQIEIYLSIDHATLLYSHNLAASNVRRRWGTELNNIIRQWIFK